MSFENHCSKPYQEKMARIIKKHIGDMIYRIPKDAENYGSYTTLDNLKNKIIIKGKAKVVTLLNLLYGADRD